MIRKQFTSGVLRRRQVLVGAGAAAFLTACGGGSQGTTNSKPSASSSGGPAKLVKGGTVTGALSNDIGSLDPLTSSSVYDRQVQYQIFESLIATDKELKLLPGLAKSWETPDPTTIVFKLQPGVKFQDGTDFNAEAVRFNFDRILQSASSPRKSEITGVVSVEATDPMTATLKLKSPFSPLLAQLVDRAGMMVSPAAVAKLGDSLVRNPANAGTGPFKFVEYQKDDHIALARNDNYWGKDSSGGALPYIDKLVYRPIVDGTQRLNSLKTGEIDFANEVDYKDIDSIKKEPSLTYAQIPALAYSGFYLNAANEVFRDVRVRQALAWSLDRQKIVDTVYFKVPVVASGPIAPPQFPYDTSYKPYTRDVAKAKSLLAAAGRGSISFNMLITAGSTQTQQFAELVKDQLKDAGFIANLQSLDFPTILANMTKHDFQAGVTGWSGRLDPDGNTYNQLHTGGGNNYGGYSNSAMDKALEDARATSDQDKRKPLYQQVNKLAAEEVPYVFVYYGVTSQNSSNKLKNFVLVPDGIYRFASVWKQA
jgi:peptide/nickel transport system substrate-binding protein